jgi:hypothetical protein
MSNEDAIEHGKITNLLAYHMYLLKYLVHMLYILILRTNAYLILIRS